MTYNMLCSPMLTNEQIKFCDAYLTAIPENLENMNKEDFKNFICETFGISPEQLAMSLSNFRLFYNDITCIHCGIRYEIEQPLAFHKLPKNPHNWTCKSCKTFLKRSFDFNLLMDWYPNTKPNNYSIAHFRAVRDLMVSTCLAKLHQA